MQSYKRGLVTIKPHFPPKGDPMRVVYRMRGLLGDATEDMVESLDTNNDDEIDNEEVFKMAAVLSTGSPSGSF